MGERGPAPRRKAVVRRRNKPDHPITNMGPDELNDLPFQIDLEPDPPASPAEWHPIVQQFWDSLQTDPARSWMTSADWGATRVFCQTLSMELNEHIIHFDKDGAPFYGIEAPRSGTLATFLQLLNHIGVTEAARLRLQKEVTLFPVQPRTDQEGNVVPIDQARRAEVQ